MPLRSTRLFHGQLLLKMGKFDPKIFGSLDSDEIVKDYTQSLDYFHVLIDEKSIVEAAGFKSFVQSNRLGHYENICPRGVLETGKESAGRGECCESSCSPLWRRYFR